MPMDDFVPIWEDAKDMGVLLGKGGLYGNVSILLDGNLCRLFQSSYITLLNHLHCHRTVLLVHSATFASTDFALIRVSNSLGR